MITIENIKIKPKPNYNRIIKALKREGTLDRVPFYELYCDVIYKVMGDIVKRSDYKDENEFSLKQSIEFQYRLGYDYVGARADFSNVRPVKKKTGDKELIESHYLASDKNFLFAKPGSHTGETSAGKRDYVQAADCIIGSWEEFEKYSWPDIDKVDYSPLENLKKYLPQGMTGYTFGPGGILSNVMWLMGYEKFSYALIEAPELVEAVFEAVGTRLVKLIKNYASFEHIGFLVINDDMGFKTQTLISPEMLREYAFPWHKKIVEAAHSYDKQIILHSCGNLKEVYEDIIQSGYDAKHSYEDIIDPIWEFKAKYGDRISCFGGFDMDKLSRFNTDEIRKHTRFIIDKCASKGGFAIGAGNSVADYVPVENFLAMLEEAYNYGKY